MQIKFDDISAAAKALQGNINKTPTINATKLGKKLGCDLFLKLECLQLTSSFKARGAYLAPVPLRARQLRVKAHCPKCNQWAYVPAYAPNGEPEAAGQSLRSAQRRRGSYADSFSWGNQES